MTKKVSKFTSIVIVLFLFTSLVTPINAKASDISGHWASDMIAKWVSAGLVKFYPDGNVKPDKYITRAEFLTFLNRVFGLKEKSDTAFKDVDAGKWYADDISKAYAAGLITGNGKGELRPEVLISRQEAAVIICKAFSLKAKDPNAASKFTDSGKFPSWSRDAINAMVENGFAGSNKDNSFGYADNITRAESIVMIDNVMGGLINQTGTCTGNFAGNLTVNAKDVILKDMTVSGNLYLTQGIGDGAVTLDNVKVKGKTFVFGGGEHSIAVKNSSLTGSLIILKKDGKVRIVAQGSSDIPDTQLNSGVILEEDGTTGPGFGDLEILRVGSGQEIKLDGYFDDVNVNSGVVITGNGLIKNATINSNGVTIEKMPIRTVVNEGFTAVIAGVTVKGYAVYPPQVVYSSPPPPAVATTPGALNLLFITTGVPGDIRTVALSYSVNEAFTQGTVVFHIPAGFEADTDDGVINLTTGSVSNLQLSQISGGGSTVTITGVDLNSGSGIYLSLVSKTIPAPGAYTFSANGDADGSSNNKSMSAGTGAETAVFTSAPAPIDDLFAVGGVGQIDLLFSKATGATGVVLEMSSDGGISYNPVGIPLDSTSEIANVPGLTNGTKYYFRLNVTGGYHSGISNEVYSYPTLVNVNNSSASIDRALNSTTPSAITVTLEDYNDDPVTTLDTYLVTVMTSSTINFDINGTNYTGSDSYNIFMNVTPNASGQTLFTVTLPAMGGSDFDLEVADVNGTIIQSFSYN